MDSILTKLSNIDFSKDVTNNVNHIGKIFECFIAYKYNLVHWSDLPIKLTKNRNNFSKKDYGIDLVKLEKDNNGNEQITEVFQIKWRLRSNFVNWREISSFHFLSVIICCDKRFLVMTKGTKILNFVKWNLEKTSISLIYIDPTDVLLFIEEIKRLQHLPISQMNNLSIFPSHTENKFEPMKLREYQNIAIDRVLSDINAKKKMIFLSMCCGSGKTLVLLHIIEKIEGEVIIFVPSLLLLNQMKKVFSAHKPYLLSGETNNFEPNKRIYISTYQSAKKIPRDYHFSLIAIDEAHHVYNYLQENNMIERDIETEDIVRDNNGYGDQDYRPWKYAETMINRNTNNFLFLSGTFAPRIKEIASFTYSIEEAIRDGYLVDYDFYIPILLNNERSMGGIATLIELNLYWSKILAYCNNRENAKRFRDILLERDITAAYYDGTTTLRERERINEEFMNNKIRCLVTVQVLSEGVNLPCANTCIFVEPRGSATNVSQCVGRVLRPSPGKRISHIVLPSNNEEIELRRFLRLLAYQDERIIIEARNGELESRICMIAGDLIDRDETEIREMVIYDRIGSELERIEIRISYEEAKKIIREWKRRIGKEIRSKREYAEMCKEIKRNKQIEDRKKFFLPDDPERFFDRNFIKWIDYLSIEENFYSLSELKQMINDNVANKTPLEAINYINQLSLIDKNIPPFDFIPDFYKIKDISELIMEKVYVNFNF